LTIDEQSETASTLAKKGENMKKRFIFIQIILLLFILLFFGACASTGSKYSTKYIAWDDSLPDEECAIIYFWGYNPTAYNGMSWKLRETPKIGVAVAYIKIPAGKSTFTGDVQNFYNFNNFEFHLSAKDVEFDYTFLPGEYYHVYVKADISTDQKFILGKMIDRNKLHISMSMSIYGDDLRSYMGFPFPKKDAEPAASIPLDVTFLD
jgi:hypothetical protein